MAGTAFLAAAPGGAAAAAAAPSAGSVPPPLGAPLPGGGPDGARPSRATAGIPSRRRQTSPTHAMQVRWTRVPYTRPTPLSHHP